MGKCTNGHSSKVEEVEEVNIGTDNDPKIIKIEKDLDPGIRSDLIQLLKDKKGVFAYSYGDMPGIDPSIAQHELKVRDDCPPKVQKRRKMAPHLRDAANAEVDKLKKVGFIREVKETTWLANIVPVGKPNGKVRVCIDYSDLNEACPKDNFPYLR